MFVSSLSLCTAKAHKRKRKKVKIKSFSSKACFLLLKESELLELNNYHNRTNFNISRIPERHIFYLMPLRLNWCHYILEEKSENTNLNRKSEDEITFVDPLIRGTIVQIVLKRPSLKLIMNIKHEEDSTAITCLKEFNKIVQAHWITIKTISVIKIINDELLKAKNAEEIMYKIIQLRSCIKSCCFFSQKLAHDCKDCNGVKTPSGRQLSAKLFL